MQKFTDRLAKARTNPAHAWALIKGQFWKPFRALRYVGAVDNRSISDDGLYAAFCDTASHSDAFRMFKRHPHYVSNLEHITKEKGTEYLEAFEAMARGLLAQIDTFKVNDMVGCPIVHEYPGLGRISPTTLRYMKVVANLQRYFGAHAIRGIAEIGVGYGGQLLVTNRVMTFDKWYLFHLPSVLKLASRYLESHILNKAYCVHPLNQVDGGKNTILSSATTPTQNCPPRFRKRTRERCLRMRSEGISR